MTLPPLGAHPHPEGTRFTLFTTTAAQCQLRLFSADGQTCTDHEMTALVDGGFQLVQPGVGAGALYKFVLDGRALPDPYARFLPQGVDGPAEVIVSDYQFRHAEGVCRPLRDHVIYELHVGTFSPEGTYAGVRARLPELRALGVTAIELMPVAAFAGTRGWGYDGVALYAPFAPYGRPDDLRAFIDDAHGHGLAVFLDVVYNHFGPAGNYLAAYSPDYFSREIKNAWGDAPNFAHPIVRQNVLGNALYWLTEFGFDGLRLDATHAIVDPSPRHILSELAEQVHGLSPRRLLVAEDERNDADVIVTLGMDGVWADDFHHQLRVTLTGEQEGYYAAYQPGPNGIADAVCGGWLYSGQVYAPTNEPRGKDASALPAHAFIYCLQNHDQIGNRALGERLSHVVTPDAYAAVSALLLFLPMTPLLFMGQEWAATTPFQFFTDHEPNLGRLISEGRRNEFRSFSAFTDPAQRASIPDPQDRATFERSRLRWDERANGRHAATLALYQKLIEFRQSDPVLRLSGRTELAVKSWKAALAVRRWTHEADRVLLINLGTEPVPFATLANDAHDRPVLLSTVNSGQSPVAPAGGPDAQANATLAPFQAVILGARQRTARLDTDRGHA